VPRLKFGRIYYLRNQYLKDGASMYGFLIECAMSWFTIKEYFLGQKEHTSFENYKEDISKLSKMAQQVEFI
jgi:hypothetical protein